MEIENNRKNKRLELEKEKSRQSEEAEEGDEIDEDDMEEVDSDEWDEENDGDVIPRNDCFFCLHHSSTLEKNAIHMSTEHSFFIPDVEYLVDLPGLFEYLGAKVIIDICSRLCFLINSGQGSRKHICWNFMINLSRILTFTPFLNTFNHSGWAGVHVFMV